MICTFVTNIILYYFKSTKNPKSVLTFVKLKRIFALSPSTFQNLYFFFYLNTWILNLWFFFSQLWLHIGSSKFQLSPTWVWQRLLFISSAVNSLGCWRKGCETRTSNTHPTHTIWPTSPTCCTSATWRVTRKGCLRKGTHTSHTTPCQHERTLNNRLRTPLLNLLNVKSVQSRPVISSFAIDGNTAVQFR